VRAEAGLVDGAGGVATYDGFGRLRGPGAAYVEGGAFRMTYDFDERRRGQPDSRNGSAR
jgi:hypothetical protein